MNATQSSPQTSELLMAHLNKHVVFRETGILILVTVQEIRITRARLRVRLELLKVLTPSGKITFPTGKSFTAGGIWEVVTVQPHVWSCSAQGACWHVIPDESSFEAVCRLCEAEPDLDSELLFYLADYVAHHPSSNKIPVEVREAALQRFGNSHPRPL